VGVGWRVGGGCGRLLIFCCVVLILVVASLPLNIKLMHTEEQIAWYESEIPKKQAEIFDLAAKIDQLSQEAGIKKSEGGNAKLWWALGGVLVVVVVIVFIKREDE